MSRHLFRFGFHDFLNAQPLLMPLKEAEARSEFQLVLDVPSTIARKLNARDLDVAMVPSIEYLRNAESYRLLTHCCIASKGPVDTVLLVSRKELGKIRTLALDIRSMTSVASLKILFGDRFPDEIQYRHISIQPQTVLDSSDAALIIGDLAFEARKRYINCNLYDLSEEWFLRTGHPFVHAVLAAQKNAVLSPKFLNLLEHLAEKAGSRIPEIARTQANRFGLTEADCKDYLQHKISYTLDDAAREGLDHFRKLCEASNLI